MLKKINNALQNKSQRPLIISIGIVLAILLILIVSRIWASTTLGQMTDRNAIQIVNIIHAKKTAMNENLVLPGSLTAWHESPIYARTNGYIKQWYVDIGYKVKSGALLAVIETPELDAELRQAEADLKAIIAQNTLAQLTAVRWVKLLKSDSVSKQETEDKVHAAEALSAKVIATRANRDRLRELVGFEQVIAPFSGTVSARGIDIGDLINAGNNPDAKPLFRIVQTDNLRLYVKIPEFYSSRIKPQMTVHLRFEEHPGQVFKARLLKTADAIDPTTRTLLAEFIVPNKQGPLLPGSYAEVTFSMPLPSHSVLLPVNVLLFRKEGLQIATVDKNNQVILKHVTIYRDFGDEVEIASAIKIGESLIQNPPDSIYNGETVRIVSTI